MLKKILAGLGILSLTLALALPVLAAETASVTATVTPGIISVSIDIPSINYGTVNIPSIDISPTTPSDPIIGASNAGGVPEDFNIYGADATGTTKVWKILDGAPTGTPDYYYNHKFIDCGDDESCGSPAAANSMDKTPESFATNVAVGDIEYFKLRLSTPTETGGDLSEHSTTVTVQASA